MVSVKAMEEVWSLWLSRVTECFCLEYDQGQLGTPDTASDWSS